MGSYKVLKVLILPEGHNISSSNNSRVKIANGCYFTKTLGCKLAHIKINVKEKAVFQYLYMGLKPWLTERKFFTKILHEMLSPYTFSC